MIGVGTRWSDFTTASRSAFQDPEVSFVNVNVTPFDTTKLAALPVVADARAALEALADRLERLAGRPGLRGALSRARRSSGTRPSRLPTPRGTRRSARLR